MTKRVKYPVTEAGFALSLQGFKWIVEDTTGRILAAFAYQHDAKIYADWISKKR